MDDEELTLPWEEDEEPAAAAEEQKAETVLTVTEVNHLARQSLERHCVTVAGEVSGLNTRYPYYVYLSLRDSECTLPAILTRRTYDGLDFPLEEGSAVVVEGMLTLFEKQGRYQVRVSAVRPFGEGELQRRIEMIKKKLQAEGLFDDARKAPLPLYPERIGVVTSPRGAAIRDVTVTLARRFPPATAYIKGVRVQGAGAVEQICAALHHFDYDFPVDVVILARGGGSVEDLEPFSTEEVARAVAAMRVPVITGIGHEPDVSIADLVADKRASTPTGAAEAAVPDRAQVLTQLGRSAAAMRRHVSAGMNASEKQVAGIRRLPLYRGYDYLLGSFMQRWERSSGELGGSPRRGLERARHRLRVAAASAPFRKRKELLAHKCGESVAIRAGLCRAVGVEVDRKLGMLERVKAKAMALSPLAVLERGYSITFDKATGAVVRSSDEVEEGAALNIRLARGSLDAQVTGKE